MFKWFPVKNLAPGIFSEHYSAHCKLLSKACAKTLMVPTQTTAWRNTVWSEPLGTSYQHCSPEGMEFIIYLLSSHFVAPIRERSGETRLYVLRANCLPISTECRESSAVQRHECNGAVGAGCLKPVVEIMPSSQPPENLNKPSRFCHCHPLRQKPRCSRSALSLSPTFILFPDILGKRGFLASCLLPQSWPCVLPWRSWLVNENGSKSRVCSVTVRVMQTLGKVFAAVATLLAVPRWASLYLALALIS